MSASCVGTCSNCGEKRVWLSDTLSLQLDDGRLKWLPHPGEGVFCEEEGLTLAQASDRGRLYRETFYVCRNCGKSGETIDRETVRDRTSFRVRSAMGWGWGTAAILVPGLAWTGFTNEAITAGIALAAWPGIAWWERRQIERALARRGLPRADAPGAMPVPAPTAGCFPDTIVGRPTSDSAGQIRATGPCCPRPDWIEAYHVEDQDRVPCSACGQGVMTVSEHAIH